VCFYQITEMAWEYAATRNVQINGQNVDI